MACHSKARLRAVTGRRPLTLMRPGGTRRRRLLAGATRSGDARDRRLQAPATNFVTFIRASLSSRPSQTDAINSASAPVFRSDQKSATSAVSVSHGTLHVASNPHVGTACPLYTHFGLTHRGADHRKH